MRHAGGWGWGIFSFVWLSAIVGFILSFKKLKEHSNLETVCYVAMGASILVAMKPLMDNLTEMGAAPAFWWLIGGELRISSGRCFIRCANRTCMPPSICSVWEEASDI